MANEEAERHLAVEVTGLDPINGRELNLFYREETETIIHGELVTCMKDFETKIFATSRKWQTNNITSWSKTFTQNGTEQ
ncbi:MAG: hypothetical protein QGI86_24300 [Candidatus Poribacteria bacterium]|nr:hypothetical protein [Candidatus Poribacteria bacterium]MDP6750406.1 hypothetical protein [Candidatus Poribacteria bacterium]MDP6996486.1 hypothetical protein [Candidatus Poribacteria bacterium]